MFKYLSRYFRKESLYPFEEAILQSVVAQMDDVAGLRLKRQIDVMNKVQRIGDGREVNLYCMKNGKPAFDDSLRFPNAPAESMLASVVVRLPDNESKLTAKVWLAEGRLFSIEFTTPPKKFFRGIDLRNVLPVNVEVDLGRGPFEHE